MSETIGNFAEVFGIRKIACWSTGLHLVVWYSAGLWQTDGQTDGHTTTAHTALT